MQPPQRRPISHPFHAVAHTSARLGLWVALGLALGTGPGWARTPHTVTLQISGEKPSPQGPSWSAGQATGAPDARAGADDAKAWAAALADGGAEWIELQFAGPIKAQAIHLHQQFNPGAVVRVEAMGPDGPTQLWAGVDSLRKAVWRIDLPAAVPVSSVRVHLDTRRVAGWNEIDAVGVLDTSGQVHWAQGAKASSYYGQPIPPTGPASLVGQRVRVTLARGEVQGVLVRDDGQFLEIGRTGQPALYVARSAVQTIESLEGPTPAE